MLIPYINNHNIPHPINVDVNVANTSLPSFPLSPSCGPKIDSLLALEEKLNALKEAQDPRVLNVAIPKTFKLNTQEVFDFLLSDNPNFFDWWLELRTLYRQNPKQFLTNPTALDLSKRGQQAIEEALKKNHKPWDARLSLWIDSLPANTYFMVRSSGAEDGLTANAGGNESKEYTTRETMDVDIGNVLASYFDFRSFNNLIQGDADPFQLLHLSLGIQELMGESMGGEINPRSIPTSGILFTNEPLYINNESFRIMRLTSIFGHGKSLVANEGIASDTFYLLQSRIDPNDLYVVDALERKTHRLCPVNGSLKKVQNPDSLKDIPSIDAPMLKRLFALGLLIEGEEKVPKDIEFVIKNEIIYIVQHRRINRKPPKPPRYVDIHTTTAPMRPMKVVIPGHLQAQAVDDFAKFLIVDTLEEAQFISGEFEANIIKCDEPANSHPIVNFSERGIPVFYHKEGLEPHQEGEITVFSSQQGMIVQGAASSITISDGLIDHPAPIRFSYLHRLPWLALKQKTIDQICALLMEFTAERTSQAASSMQTTPISLQTIKQAAEWKKFKARVSQSSAFSDAGRKLIIAVRSTIQELKRSLVEGRRAEQLFYAKALRVLLTGGKFSVLSLNQILEQTLVFEKTNSHRLAKELVVPTVMPETQNDWADFLQAVDLLASPAQIEALLILLDKLGSLRPLWITFYFSPTRALPPLDRLSNLLSQIDEDSLDFLHQIQSLDLGDFLKGDFIEQFQRQRPQAKVMSLSYLSPAIKEYDTHLKALLKTQLPLRIRTDAFKEKLIPYMTLMSRMARELVGEGKFHFPTGTLERYLSRFEEAKRSIYSKPYTEELLKTSGFSALVARLGSGVAFFNQIPITLGDLFTLTHQNILACFEILLMENLPPLHTVALPPLMGDIITLIQILGTVNFIGIEQKKNELILKYNIPQRNHSSTCQLHFKDGEISLAFQMLGPRIDRWGQSAALVHTFNLAGLLNAENIWVQGQILNFTIPLANIEIAQRACNLIRIIYDVALAQTQINKDQLIAYNIILDHEAMFTLLSRISNIAIIRNFEPIFRAFSDLAESASEASLLMQKLSISPKPILKWLGFRLALHMVQSGRLSPEIVQLLNLFQYSLTDYNHNGAGIALALELISNRMGLSEAVGILQRICHTIPDGALRPGICLKLARALVKHGVGYAEAMLLLQKTKYSGPFGSDTLKLLHALIEQGQASVEMFGMLEVVADSILDFSEFSSVFKALASVEGMATEAYQLLLRLTQNSSNSKICCLKLLDYLLTYEKDATPLTYSLLDKIVENSLKSNPNVPIHAQEQQSANWVLSGCLSILRKLADKGEPSKLILSRLNKILRMKNAFDISGTIIVILDLLANRREKLPPVAFDLLAQIFKGGSRVKPYFFDFLNSLVLRGEGHVTAREVGLKYATCSNFQLRSKAFLLLKSLKEQGVADAAILTVLENQHRTVETPPPTPLVSDELISSIKMKSIVEECKAYLAKGHLKKEYKAYFAKGHLNSMKPLSFEKKNLELSFPKINPYLDINYNTYFASLFNF
ncbi:MAG: PEP/pyruvate-binding domain-containing protein [Chlamydiales bacterium]